MAQASTRTLDVEQGTDYTFSFIVKDSGGSPIDLIAENTEVRMRVKTDYSLGAITILTLSSTGTPNSNITLHVAAVTGNITVTVPKADTIALTLSEEQTSYVYDIEAELDSTGTQRLYKGDFNIFKENATPDSDFV